MHDETTPPDPSDREAHPPPQQQEAPGRTDDMEPRPQDEMAGYRGAGLLEGRRAVITGGDSGIGRAVAVAFAKEGADVVIGYLDEHDDAQRTVELIEREGRAGTAVPGDLSREADCIRLVEEALVALDGIDLLVNNLATQAPQDSLLDISSEQWERTLHTNLSSYFWVTKAALPHLDRGSSIVNTASINGLRGNKSLIDYSATKGAIIALTYSLAQSLMDDGIRVNCVAPGPVWTPLIPATMPEEKVDGFGEQTPMGRVAQPDEIAPSYVFFASERQSSYYTGEVLAPIGGETLPG